MPTTYDLTGQSGAGSAVPINGTNRRGQVTATITVPLLGVTNDILQCIPIKKGQKCHGISMVIVTAGAGTTVALDIGITGGTAAGFDSQVDAKAAAGTVTQSVLADTYPAAGGFYATADDTIDILLHTITAMTTAPVVKLIADIETIVDSVDYVSPAVVGAS